MRLRRERPDLDERRPPAMSTHVGARAVPGDQAPVERLGVERALEEGAEREHIPDERQGGVAKGATSEANGSRGTPRAGHPEGTWLASDSALARRVGRPLATFVRIEAAGAALLAVAVVAGLVWANSPWQGGYRALWATEVIVRIGPVHFDETLRSALNDGAMVLFFFVIGLEIKRELVDGSLRHPRAVLLPVAAAVGGMVVPAALYAVLTVGTSAERGWAVPMATDVALALGVLLLAGRRVPRSLVTFLLTLAVVDDIGVIGVIATFYNARIHVGWLVASLALFGVVVAMKRLRIWHVPAYVVVGTVVWYATWRSGIHPTIAGVALGLLAPARPLHPLDAHRAVELRVPDAGQVRRAGFLLRESISVAERLQDIVQPWVAFAILPLFALANAGVTLDASAFDGLVSHAGIAVVLARLFGKPLGIVGAAWLAVRLAHVPLPAGVRWGQLAWIGVLGGVGFTVSVYVASLAFAETGLDAAVKLAIMASAVASAVASGTGLRRSVRRESET